MDPMSALSVATAVIALVDFGAKLVARTFEIRDLGGRGCYPGQRGSYRVGFCHVGRNGQD
jgi:hypothetical protein